MVRLQSICRLNPKIVPEALLHLLLPKDINHPGYSPLLLFLMWLMDIQLIIITLLILLLIMLLHTTYYYHTAK
ncbi:hypothetical protein GBA52_004540 [Prunus armeniaca]|nr:hypothetical protein GBA52_004540 [Prunus armeniaca]